MLKSLEEGRPIRKWLRSIIDDEGKQLWYSITRATPKRVKKSDLEELEQTLKALSFKERQDLMRNI